MQGRDLFSPMKVISLPIEFYGKLFSFNMFLGCLVCRPMKAASVRPVGIGDLFNTDKQRCIDAVRDPFLMHPRAESDGWKQVEHKELIRAYAHLLTWLCRHCYPVASLCGRWNLGLFANGGDASAFYYSVYPDMKKQLTLCLPRSLFVATTSKRFRDHGVLFMGTFLPTVRMHAWVVEDTMPADTRDKQWIHYQPVMIML